MVYPVAVVRFSCTNFPREAAVAGSRPTASFRPGIVSLAGALRGRAIVSLSPNVPGRLSAVREEATPAVRRSS